MDYKQEIITTIHDFGCDLNFLETRTIQLSEQFRTAILIPALYDELERPALSGIRDHLSQCRFVKTVVVSLYAQTIEQYAKAIEFFSVLPQKTFVIWENGSRVTGILERLRDRGLDLLRFRGKGQAVWLGLGVATLEAEAIALHDADILTYDRSYPLKLLFPLLEKEFGLAFNKAYYARLGNETRNLNGRVARLFVTPLLTALTELFGYRDYLRYLNAFRYPLSGEFALNSDLALTTRIPGNWGLEIGMLAEVYRSVAQKRIAQVDLGIFDHKHQDLGQSSQHGLQKMCRDILHSVLRTLTETEQVAISMDHIHALRVKFRREAQDFTRQYFVDAVFNQLPYDRHQEEVIVEVFEQVILEAGEQYFINPAGAQIPDWTRALAVMPDLREQLQAAAMADAQDVLAMSASEANVSISNDLVAAG
ncbi:MAG: glucosyl-3-phosphoglycerate synthase [Cyanobacteria bacterium SID2]|nr:glucosyl-3-phosphoglycerate synthase [Cyanobacteria bacterium SID2]MBP0006715.1 glucosyl-3-phosphoglycerate synthase [Cyanobacteria bacterium SBC]